MALTPAQAARRARNLVALGLVIVGWAVALVWRDASNYAAWACLAVVTVAMAVNARSWRRAHNSARG